MLSSFHCFDLASKAGGMMEESQKRWITPNYQANLNAGIRDAVVCLNHGDQWGAWECLQMLFICLAPPVVEDECKKDFEEIQTLLSWL